MRLPDCPSCGENDWIGPTNQICANCLRGLSPEEKREIEEVLIGNLRELLTSWNTREYHLGEAQNERRKELERCRRELEEVLE